ncbi:hypothetical protein CVT26_003134 [Gymnopilus dilepis]|uniref:Uncharacterized protein n=1 Tax=Gymnopilus dilepis TaxID=231916 RepID=A0A409Y4L3_9AGAR|nr:hypothetical protein CVT26_003134 [Gymnopilus dilepis]
MISPPRPDMSFPNSQPTTPLRFLGGGCFRSAPNIIYMTDADFEPPDDDAEPSPAVVSTDTQAPLPQADLEDDESSNHPQKKMKSFRSFLKKFRNFAAIFRTFKAPAILSRL